MKKHDCLLFGGGRNPVELRLENGDVSVQLTLFARMIVSDMAILQAVATAGLGIAILPAMRSIQELSVRPKNLRLVPARPTQWTVALLSEAVE